MFEFIQSYGIWIVFGVLFWLMKGARRQGGRMHDGCGMDELRRRALPGEEGRNKEASETFNGKERAESRTAQR